MRCILRAVARCAAFPSQHRGFAVTRTLSELLENLPDPKVDENDPVVDQKDAPLDRAIYQSYLDKYEHGDISYLSYPKHNVELYIAGTNFANVSARRLYKLLNCIQARRVFLQVRPDQLLDGFRYFPTTPSNFFDQKAYFQQLAIPPEDLMPSTELAERIRQELRQAGLLLGEPSTPQPEFDPFVPRERLAAKLLGVVSLWATRNRPEVLLCDLPDKVYRQTLANSLSLMQLQDIFSAAATRRGYEPDDQPRSVFGSAIRLYPDILLHLSDRYMAAVLKSLMAERDQHDSKPEKWVLFCGFGQTKALEHYLERPDGIPLESCLEVPDRYESLLRADSLDMLIDKIALLDVIPLTVHLWDAVLCMALSYQY